MKRRKSRELAFKLLYALELSGNDPMTVLNSFTSLKSPASDNQQEDSDIWDYAVQVYNWTVDLSSALDADLPSVISNWSLDRLSKVDKVLIYMACAEIQSAGAPYEVVINEVLEISKCYGDKSTPSFINGVIDSWYTKR